MEEKKVLDIEQNALLRGYSYSANMMAIVNPAVCFSGSDCQVEDLVFFDSAGEHREYKCWENDHPECKATIDIQDNGRSIIINTLNTETKGKTYAFLYESAESKWKTCQTKVVSFKQSHTCSFCGISLASITDGNRREYRFGFFSNHRIGYVYVDLADNFESYHLKNNIKDYQYVKLEMNDMELIGSFSCDGLTWDEYPKEKNLVPIENRMIGFLLWTGDDFFKNWFYTNYIQLHSSFDMSLMYDVKLDYYLGFQFFGMHNAFNPWLKVSTFDPLLLPELDCFEILKRTIDSGYYVELMLNEKYIKNRGSYQKYDYDHENMIYGYDLTEDKVYICGFNEHQLFSFDTISIESFKNAYMHLSDSYDWTLQKYDVQYYEYGLKKEIIIQMLREYRDGIDSSYHEELKINQKIRVFGTKIYQVLKDNIQQVKDQRVPYIIYEHKKIMSQRIKYLQAHDLLSKQDADVLLTKSTELEKMSHKLLLLGMKYDQCPKEKDEERIKRLIDTIYQYDIDFINDFIQKLEI